MGQKSSKKAGKFSAEESKDKPGSKNATPKQADDAKSKAIKPKKLDRQSSTLIIQEMLPNTTVGAQLAKVPILSSLTKDERDKLGGALDEVEFAPNEVVFRQGDDGDTFFLVKEGVAQVSINSNVVCELSSGDYFGEQSILKDQKRGATITAVGDTSLKLWKLTKDKFQALFKDDRINVNFLERNNGVIFEQARGAVVAANFEGTGDMDDKFKNTSPYSDDKFELVQRAVNKCLLFQQLDQTQRKMVVNVMQQVKVKSGDVIIKEGEDGDTFYVVEDGKFDVYQYDKDLQDDKVVDNKVMGDCFGELALMYNAPRNATVVASSDATLRSVRQHVFSRLVREAREKQVYQFSEWLKEVELLKPLSNFERLHLVEAIELVDFDKGTILFDQGDAGDAMYVVVEGAVNFSIKNDKGEYTKIEGPKGTCHPGDYFGERALMNNAPRKAAASCGEFSRLLKIDRTAFEAILGPLSSIMKKKEETYADTTTHVKVDSFKQADVKFENLVTKQVLGKGSYGFVTLVEDAKTKILYALKAVSKMRVVETNQKAHIFNEKNLLARVDFPFLIKLHATFKDRDMLYFLMEPARGGELFRILRRCRAFPVQQAKFYAGCVILGFEYLHKQNLIYRDLKPENLLLDEHGYCKITDFGFLKEVVSKTYTMCGTPEYMAPEIVQQKGHGRQVDWWCVGIFIYEMLASHTPFFVPNEDQMKMYKRIVVGRFKFPNYLVDDAKDLITGLLHIVTSRRLGCGVDGAAEIKSAAWFNGFDWEALLWRKMKAPLIPPEKAIEKLSNFGTHAEPPKNLKPYVDDGTNWDADF